MAKKTDTRTMPTVPPRGARPEDNADDLEKKTVEILDKEDAADAGDEITFEDLEKIISEGESEGDDEEPSADSSEETADDDQDEGEQSDKASLDAWESLKNKHSAEDVEAALLALAEQGQIKAEKEGIERVLLTASKLAHQNPEAATALLKSIGEEGATEEVTERDWSDPDSYGDEDDETAALRKRVVRLEKTLQASNFNQWKQHLTGEVAKAVATEPLFGDLGLSEDVQQSVVGSLLADPSLAGDVSAAGDRAKALVAEAAKRSRGLRDRIIKSYKNGKQAKRKVPSTGGPRGVPTPASPSKSAFNAPRRKDGKVDWDKVTELGEKYEQYLNQG